MGWDIVIDPKFPDKTTALNGTFEEILMQAAKINPNFYTDFNITDPSAQVNATTDPAETKATARTGAAKHTGNVLSEISTHICFPDKWLDAFLTPIQQGIDDIYKIEGKPILYPGPARCSRVSCRFASAIWWCNDVSPVSPNYFCVSFCL